MRTGRPKINDLEKKITISILMDCAIYDELVALNIPNKSELINELLEEHYLKINKHCLNTVKVIKKTISLTNIYFIQAVNGGPIKIGKSSNPESRIKTLQGGNPSELHIIKVIKNVPPIEEINLHEKFKQYRIIGEWFDESISELI